jgi:hypothetical protein
VVPTWQVNLLRAEALIALERWPEAKVAAGAAIELNPNAGVGVLPARPGPSRTRRTGTPRDRTPFARAYEIDAAEVTLPLQVSR